MSLKNLGIDRYLFLSFLIGLIPASFLIHMVAIDFSAFYVQAISFLKYHGYSYQIITSYCQNPINSGLNARAPFVPLMLAGSLSLFGPTLLGIYVPFFLARIFIAPLTYLVGKFVLPARVAFLAAVLTVFIPKLQTYSFGALEADVFVAFFYLVALVCYLKSEHLGNRYSSLAGLALGLGALSKSTGFAVGAGFILAVVLEQGSKIIKIKYVRERVLTLIIYFLLLAAPFLTWTYVAHGQFYISTQHDRSLTYIFANLPALLATIPLYLTGVDFSVGGRLTLVASTFILFFGVGLVATLRSRQFTLTVPTLFTMLLISTLSSCLIGGNTPYTIEFVTILGFAMPVVAIIFFKGANGVVRGAWGVLSHRSIPHWLTTFFFLLLMFKFINNYFSAKYALDFIPVEYYVSLPTILKHREPFRFGEIKFQQEKGLRISQGPAIHREIRFQFSDFRFKPFSPFYRAVLLIPTAAGLLLFVLDRNNYRIERPSLKFSSKL